MALTHILVVADTGRSRRWCVETLGAELHREYEESVVLRFLDSWLLLVTGGGLTQDKPGVTMGVPEPGQSTVVHSFTIQVPDCQAAYDTLVGRGALFLTPPHDRGSEIRCFFRDPDGHLFEIGQAG